MLNEESGKNISSDAPNSDSATTGGGDVELGINVEIERVELSEEELAKLGYRSVEEMLRAELHDSQGANAGYNTGINAKQSLNVGLSESGRQAFKDARKKVIAEYYAGRLIGALSSISTDC